MPAKTNHPAARTVPQKKIRRGVRLASNEVAEASTSHSQGDIISLVTRRDERLDTNTKIKDRASMSSPITQIRFCVAGLDLLATRNAFRYSHGDPKRNTVERTAMIRCHSDEADDIFSNSSTFQRYSTIGKLSI